MKCSKCGQREATIEVLHATNNHAEKLYLCDICAAELRRNDIEFAKFSIFNNLFGSPMDLVGGFGGLFGTQGDRTVVCPDCKTTSDEFLKTGYVGCPRCYEVFEPLVRRTVKKLQQSDIHVGKAPYGGGGDDETALRTQLKAAVEREDYALASKISERLEQIQLHRNEKGE